jgi:hypothetical protein
MAREIRTNIQPDEAARQHDLDAIKAARNPVTEVQKSFAIASEPVTVHTGRPGGRRKIVRLGNLYQPGSQMVRVRKAKGDPMVACYNQAGLLIGLCDPDALVEVASGDPADDDDDSGPQYSDEAKAAQATSVAQQTAPATKSLERNLLQGVAPLVALWKTAKHKEELRVRKSGRAPKPDAVKVVCKLGGEANANRVTKGLVVEMDPFEAGMDAWGRMPKGDQGVVERELRNCSDESLVRLTGKSVQLRPRFRGGR